jgi:hypothetical protein
MDTKLPCAEIGEEAARGRNSGSGTWLRNATASVQLVNQA